jgi:hypothetical protein
MRLIIEATRTNERSRLCNLALSRGGLTKPISPLMGWSTPPRRID